MIPQHLPLFKVFFLFESSELALDHERLVAVKLHIDLSYSEHSCSFVWDRIGSIEMDDFDDCFLDDDLRNRYRIGSTCSIFNLESIWIPHHIVDDIGRRYQSHTQPAVRWNDMTSSHVICIRSWIAMTYYR